MRRGRLVGFLGVVVTATLALAGCTSGPVQKGGSSQTSAPLSTSTPPTGRPAGVLGAVAAATVAPSSGPDLGNCKSGTVSLTVTSPDDSTCVTPGSELIVTFDPSHVAIGVDSGWTGQPTVNNGSVLGLTGSSEEGSNLVGTAKALTVGTATLLAFFSQQCSAGDSTPCTIPPQGVLRLHVSVVTPCTSQPNYIERMTEPGLLPSATEVCMGTLSDFPHEVGIGSGECTQIALASNNPGYDVLARPASALKDVITQAGPGC